jgi:hypothetical protein
MRKRKTFDEMMEGVGAMKSHRELLLPGCKSSGLNLHENAGLKRYCTPGISSC